MNAEYFLEVLERSQSDDKKGQDLFEFKYNPFRFDILGKKIDFDQSVPKLSHSLLLRPELETMREQPWLQNEAIVMADVIHPDTEEVVEYAPRNMLKQALSQVELP